MVLTHIGDHFTLDELIEAIEHALTTPDAPKALGETAENVVWLTRSNCYLEALADIDPSEIVIFPSTENESRGIEDVRLVRVTDDDGSVQYYETYTAFNGFHILPQLIETEDFRTVQVHAINGRHAQNRGLPCFRGGFMVGT